METVIGVLVVLHLIGFATVFGATVSQVSALRAGTARILPGTLHGAWLLFATGLLLVGTVYMAGGSPNNAKIGVKFAVLLALIVVLLINRKKQPVSGAVLGTVAGLSVLNVCLAVLWD